MPSALRVAGVTGAEFEACWNMAQCTAGEGCRHLSALPAGQEEVGTGQGDGTFSLDPTVLFKSNRLSMLHKSEIR